MREWFLTNMIRCRGEKKKVREGEETQEWCTNLAVVRPPVAACTEALHVEVAGGALLFPPLCYVDVPYHQAKQEAEFEFGHLLSLSLGNGIVVPGPLLLRIPPPPFSFSLSPPLQLPVNERKEEAKVVDGRLGDGRLG